MGNFAGSVNADFLAISKTEPVLYITGRNSLELFSMNLDDVEEPLSHEAEPNTVSRFYWIKYWRSKMFS